MAASWVYYISGHGFGHAQRSGHVAGEFARRWPDCPVEIRTAAPQRIFENLGPAVRYHRVEIDCGVIEKTPLELDWAATLADLRRRVEGAGMEALVRSEAAWLKACGTRLIVADIPWLAGYIGQAAGIPCYAQGNFTWDWIYQPHLDGSPAGRELLQIVTGGYQRMAGWLRLPFPHEYRHMTVAADAPLVDTLQVLPRQTVLAKLGIDAADTRPRILIAMRGGLDEQALAAAVREAPDLLYLASGSPTLPAGAVAIPAGVSFWDALSVCDLAISKLGHGIVTDTLSHGVRLLWPQRNGFREDAMLAAAAGAYGVNAQIPTDDFVAGRWAGHVRKLLQCPLPPRRYAVDGAAFIANWIGRRLGL